MSIHCERKNHSLPTPLQQRVGKGALMVELLDYVKEDLLVETVSPRKRPSNDIGNHPAVSFYLTKLSENSSAEISSSSSSSSSSFSSSSSSSSSFSSSSSSSFSSSSSSSSSFSFSSSSSSPSSSSSSSSSGDLAGKRSASESYSDLLKSFQISSFLREAQEDYSYYFMVVLEHNQLLEASRVLCLLPHRRGENTFKCRDKSHGYRNRFKVHIGNWKKHL